MMVTVAKWRDGAIAEEYIWRLPRPCGPVVIFDELVGVREGFRIRLWHAVLR